MAITEKGYKLSEPTSHPTEPAYEGKKALTDPTIKLHAFTAGHEPVEPGYNVKADPVMDIR